MSYGRWKRHRSKNLAKMSLAELVRSQLQDASPLAKLTAANEHAVSRRTRSKNAAKRQLLDLRNHGTVVGTGYASEPVIAVRWVGNDFVVTRAQYLQPWRDWPDEPSFRARWRSGARATSLVGIGALGFPFGATKEQPWMPDLRPCLESVGVLRLVPPRGRFFENDSMVHWSHHVRDGIYDVWAGMILDKNGDPVWLGQRADDDNKLGFIPCQYNQVKADGHGIATVFRFRQEFVDAMPNLLPQNARLLAAGS